MHIQKEELFEGAQDFKKGGGIVVKPNRDVLVRLDALDRLGDALQKTKLQRLILHTCRAGSDAEFMQLVANRLQVPVRGQRDYIWFSDDYSIYHSELTQAEKDDPTLTPTGLTSKHEKFWIVHKLSNIFFPKDAPQRYGVS